MTQADARSRSVFLLLSRDGRLLFVTCAIRNFAYGFLSIVLGLYLAALGLDSTAIGTVFTAALIGGAVMTIVLTTVADRWGRRLLLVAGSVLMALAGGVFATTDQLGWLLLAAIVGTISPSGKDVGPFLSIEQAILPSTVDARQRTDLFAAYNLVASLATAGGALAVGLPELLGLAPLAGYQLLVWGYAGTALILAMLFSRLSPAAEAPTRASMSAPSPGFRQSRGMVAKLAVLFSVDAFAGGFIVQGLMAYWLSLRFDADTSALAGIFFGINLCAALSFLAAAPLARRFGLLNTMVFTHLPSNLMLLAVPLMPTLGLAVGLLLARHLLSQMDVPTRQSYTMAIVEPEERASAAGILSVARSAAAGIAPAFAGATLAVPALGLPFLVAGGLKVIYDLCLFATFRGIRPPEETGA
jgi:MFS family permease